MTARGDLTDVGREAIRHVAEGTDNADRSVSPFVSLSHALRWYQQTLERHGTLESTLGRQIRTLHEMGVNVQRTAQAERVTDDLWLAARVGMCLPRPRGQEPARVGQAGYELTAWTEPWLQWRAFVAMLAGADVADIARRIEQWTGHHLTWKRAGGLTRSALSSFYSELASHGLVSRGSLVG